MNLHAEMTNYRNKINTNTRIRLDFLVLLEQSFLEEFFKFSISQYNKTSEKIFDRHLSPKRWVLQIYPTFSGNSFSVSMFSLYTSCRK